MRNSTPRIARLLAYLRYQLGPEHNHWLRSAIGFWTILVVVVAVKCILKPYMHAVFPSYGLSARVTAGVEGLTHTPSSAYISRQYGPAFTDMVLPFTQFGDRIGGALWSIASIALLLTGFRSVFVQLAPKNWTEREFGMCLWLLPWFGLASLYNGQLNIAITGCLLWGTSTCVRQRWWQAAFWFALPAAVKIYPLAVPLVLCTLYPRRLTWRLAVAVAVVCLAPGLFHSVDYLVAQYTEWFAYLSSGQHYTLALVRVCMRTVIERWIGPVASTSYLPFQLMTALFVAMLAAVRRKESGTAKVMTAYALASFWMVLFGPATEEATYLLAGPAVAFVLVDAFRRGEPTTVLCLIGVAAAMAGPLQTSILGETVRRGVLNWKLAPLGLLTVLLYVVGKELRALRVKSPLAAEDLGRVTLHPGQPAPRM